jgi:hypothetical protein
VTVLEDLLRDATAGDPISEVKWTRKTVRRLSRELRRRGLKVGRTTVRRLLRKRGYALRVNRKRKTKAQDPRRDRQMQYIARLRRTFKKAGFPVVSVDAKKRELVGDFRNAGRTWRRKPIEVLATDFRRDAEGVAIPYGVYDVARNEGYVTIGTAHETPAFAVAALRRWWERAGQPTYGDQAQVLIEADDGGANDSRCWLWKWELQQMADEFQIAITVTHYPAGASKWNPVEHRLFSPISLNWAGQPLASYETILKFIRTARTETGLRCWAWLDQHDYPTGLKITAEQKAEINLKPHRVLPNWNYTIEPHAVTQKK